MRLLFRYRPTFKLHSPLNISNTPIIHSYSASVFKLQMCQHFNRIRRCQQNRGELLLLLTFTNVKMYVPPTKLLFSTYQIFYTLSQNCNKRQNYLLALQAYIKCLILYCTFILINTLKYQIVTNLSKAYIGFHSFLAKGVIIWGGRVISLLAVNIIF